ncbi:MAG: class I SAM-dependent rRNA methyltransferase [Planctomycetota bacterium]|nr:MAG: class I SAM-dependent rRNA methyltransferase [Planctomycetota bacterium]
MSRPERWIRLRGKPRGPRAFRRDLAETAPGLGAGDLTALLAADGDEILGWGLYHPSSQVAWRELRRGPEPPDEEWVRAAARAAAERRRRSPEIDERLCRVVHAEGDDLPALVVDRYGDLLAVELFSTAALPLARLALPELHEALGTRHHRLALDAAAARAEGEAAWVETSPGCPELVQVEEDGIRFEIDLRRGHKTGFFLDQRENRARLRRQVAAVEEAEVLDVCCYSGGFALAAAAAGAAAVTAVDLDEEALAMARRNANLNRSRSIRFVQADAFGYLRTLAANGRSFDFVVLDPPKFVPSRRERERGLARYHDLNKLALPLVRPGGLLLTCSCSGLLSALEFQERVRQAARRAGRTARLERLTGAGPDHPVRLDFPEGAYLKALWLRIT